MVFRMRTWWQRHFPALVATLALAVIFVFPWLFRDALGIEHDTFFHLSRIQGLAEAIGRGDFLPAIYPYKNNGFGYGSPMFYCDLLLIPFALLYRSGASLTVCYQVWIFIVTWASAYAMFRLLSRFTKKNLCLLVVTAAYLFSNYRITDTYVRSSAGELTAMIFLPVLLSALYDIGHDHEKYGAFLLTVSLDGLIFSHNLTFLFGVILVVLHVLINRHRLNAARMKALAGGTLAAFLLSAWYTLPMIEQLTSQDFLVSYYAFSSDLADGAMTIRQFFTDVTVFGYSGISLPASRQMVVNIGLFMELIPLFWFATPKESRTGAPFVRECLILGYIFMLMPIKYLPWDTMTFLRIIQFPWRLETMALPLLAVPACFALDRLPFKKAAEQRIFQSVLLLSVMAEGIWHIMPVLDRTFILTSQSTYEQIIDGELIDPYYSATYMRVECAGGDYIPINSPDFRTYSTAIKTLDGRDTGIIYEKSGTDLRFTLTDGDTSEYILPVTWYKGYQVYCGDIPVETYSSSDSMVCFKAIGGGTYTCRYTGTVLQKGCCLLSLVSVILIPMIVYRLNHRKKKS